MELKTAKYHMKFILPMLEEGLSLNEISRRYKYSDSYVRKIISFWRKYYLRNQEKFHIEIQREKIRKSTQHALDRLKSLGVKLGRPKGSKDKTKRRTIGYQLRYQEVVK